MQRPHFVITLAVCALVLSACSTLGMRKPVCASCGTVVAIEASNATQAAPHGGVVLGGIVGGVAASQPTTPAKPQAPASPSYTIHVRMDDGRTLVVHQSDLGGVRRNAPVRVINGKAVAATTVTAKP